MMDFTVNRLNHIFKDKHPSQIVRWVYDNFSDKVVASSSFGTDSALMLHLIKQHAPKMKIIFVDTGYLTTSTYKHLDRLTKEFGLEDNLKIYTPLRSRSMQEAIDGTYIDRIYSDDEEVRKKFNEENKIEPMARALKELGAEFWISGVTRDSEERNKLKHVMPKNGLDVYRIYPVIDWSTPDVKEYVGRNNLPMNTDYFDVCKLNPKKECGLHLNGKEQGSNI